MKKGVENFQRRTWDKAEYEKFALQREDRERTGGKSAIAVSDSLSEDVDLSVDTGFAKVQYAEAGSAGPSGSSKAFLDVEKSRQSLDLESKVGKVEKVAGGFRQAGYHCPVCDRVFADSSSLLDHFNSREHQSRLGYSMHTMPSSKEQVKSRLSAHIAKASSEVSSTKSKSSAAPVSFEQLVKQAQARLDVKKDDRKSKKKQKVSSAEPVSNEEEEGQDPEMKALLGFGSFGA